MKEHRPCSPPGDHPWNDWLKKKDRGQHLELLREQRQVEEVDEGENDKRERERKNPVGIEDHRERNRDN
jgi:hypothetical protein